MIDLKDIRRRITGAANEQGVCGPTWINPREAVALLDMLEAAQQDADRWRQATRNYEIQDVAVVVYDKYGNEMLVTEDEADLAIDAAMAATKGEA